MIAVPDDFLRQVESVAQRVRRAGDSPPAQDKQQLGEGLQELERLARRGVDFGSADGGAVVRA